METPQELAEELVSFYEAERVRGFPYADCRKLLDLGGQIFDALIPDLDMFFYNIASPASNARRLLNRPRVQLLPLQQQLDRSFFEKHPEYMALQEQISPENTPDLYRKMILHEFLRTKLLALLRALLEEPSTRAT